MQENENPKNVVVGLNRKVFIKNIFEKEFNSNVRQCALALEMAPNYLRDLLYTPTCGAGTATLTNICRYCMKTGKDPVQYILTEPKK
jgi:hypothetical protein